MGPPLIREPQIAPDSHPSLRDLCIRLQIYLLALQAPPEPLDEDVVQEASLPVLTDLDTPLLEDAGECLIGELGLLVCIEDLWRASAQRLLQGVDIEGALQRVGEPQARAQRLCQSMNTTRYRKPWAMGIYVMSALHT